MKLMSAPVLALFMTALATACGGSDAETICEKAQECLGGDEEGIADCTAGIEDSPAGVLEECATCVDTHTCSEIETECTTACAELDITTGGGSREDSAAAICEDLRACFADQIPATCEDELVAEPEATDEELAACATCVDEAGCAGIEAGDCDAACGG